MYEAHVVHTTHTPPHFTLRLRWNGHRFSDILRWMTIIVFQFKFCWSLLHRGRISNELALDQVMICLDELIPFYFLLFRWVSQGLFQNACKFSQYISRYMFYLICQVNRTFCGGHWGWPLFYRKFQMQFFRNKTICKLIQILLTFVPCGLNLE